MDKNNAQIVDELFKIGKIKKCSKNSIPTIYNLFNKGNM